MKKGLKWITSVVLCIGVTTHIAAQDQEITFQKEKVRMFLSSPKTHEYFVEALRKYREEEEKNLERLEELFQEYPETRELLNTFFQTFREWKVDPHLFEEVVLPYFLFGVIDPSRMSQPFEKDSCWEDFQHKIFFQSMKKMKKGKHVEKCLGSTFDLFTDFIDQLERDEDEELMYVFDWRYTKDQTVLTEAEEELKELEIEIEKADSIVNAIINRDSLDLFSQITGLNEISEETTFSDDQLKEFISHPKIHAFCIEFFQKRREVALDYKQRLTELLHKYPFSETINLAYKEVSKEYEKRELLRHFESSLLPLLAFGVLNQPSEPKECLANFQDAQLDTVFRKVLKTLIKTPNNQELVKVFNKRSDKMTEYFLEFVISRIFFRVMSYSSLFIQMEDSMPYPLGLSDAIEHTNMNEELLIDALELIEDFDRTGILYEYFSYDALINLFAEVTEQTSKD